jgi:archaellum component FlaG (FlaF/FlaG flagellin family)
MKIRAFVIMICSLSALASQGQSLEFVDSQPAAIQASFSERVRIPLIIKNTGDKPHVFTIRLANELGSTQKGYFCLDKNCVEQINGEFTKRLEPGEALKDAAYILETGILTSQAQLRFEAQARGIDPVEYSILVSVEERKSRFIFQTKDVSIHDVYPNPIIDVGFIEYKLSNDQVKARLMVHNILGTRLGEYDLIYGENRVKVTTDELSTGVYFYTLYIDNQGVVTRKMLVRK